MIKKMTKLKLGWQKEKKTIQMTKIRDYIGDLTTNLQK